MRPLIWGIVGLCGLGAIVQLIGVHGATDERAAIRRALRAPFQDLRRRDARALCEDFTPPVAARLAEASPGSCPAQVGRLFRVSRGDMELVAPQSSTARGRGAVTAIAWRGDHASALSSLLGASNPSRRWRLLREHGRWRISTPVTLRMRSDCTGHLLGAHGCVEAFSIDLAQS
ncbi:MAG TPA: hypothetical protein VL988_02990 [Solirubrobacteraceae bacterium]|nr:hypothetical protein [Solirubrobacteraceae bacterium]